MGVCVCVRACARERERERESKHAHVHCMKEGRGDRWRRRRYICICRKQGRMALVPGLSHYVHVHHHTCTQQNQQGRHGTQASMTSRGSTL